MKNLYKALAQFQYDCPIIHKGTSGYGYTYADLSEIMQVITPLLKKHGLGFTQVINENNLKTILFHVESGEMLESSITIQNTVNLKGMNEFQTLGSCITYLRRYSLSAILGIVTDKDTDANYNKQEPVKQAPKEDQKVIEALKTELFVLLENSLFESERDGILAKLHTMTSADLSKGIAWAKKKIQEQVSI